MKYLVLALILLNAQSVHAVEDCNCQSQLLRVDVQSSAISQLLNSNNHLNGIGATSIEAFLNSDAFKNNVLKDYPIESMGFPFNKSKCDEEQSQNNPRFKNIDCKNQHLCSDASVSEEIKNQLCVGLPCSMIVGSQNMAQCYDKASARPAILHFSEPVSVKKLDMKPTSITSENNVLRACFKIDEMEVGVGVSVEFNKDPKVTYENMGVKDLKIVLDGQREICMSAKLNIGTATPISDIKIEKKAEVFVSDAMVNRAIAGSSIHGLSGYSPATIGVLKLTAMPPLARYFRPTIEDAVQSALASTFETQISGYLKSVNSGPTQVATPSNSFVSEMGVGNIVVKKYVDLMDCALMKSEKVAIPTTHACMNLAYPFKGGNLLKLKDVPTPQVAARMISEELVKNDQVTSESLRLRLLEFEKRMNKAPLNQVYQSAIKPASEKIAAQQLQSNIINGVEIFSRLGDENSTNGFGLSLTGICDVTNPSSHAGREIPNCPIQTYVDLDELNKLMTAMYKSGRLCHQGSGDYAPELDNRGQQVRNGDGSPRGKGCLFRVEEDQDGMRCYLNGAPQLKFDPATGAYKVQLNTKECFRGSVALGQGKIGGDINFEIGYNPAICENGDFCLKDGDAKWSVVPGTARYALKESSWFNGIVRKTVDKKLNEILGQTIRIPLSSATSGPMSMIPLEAEGRIDKGPGYFGACLKTKAQ